MLFPECLTKAHLNSSFAGVEMSQAWNDLALWEEFFNRANVKSVLELGAFLSLSEIPPSEAREMKSGRGGMTMSLTPEGMVRGFTKVTTIDHQPRW